MRSFYIVAAFVSTCFSQTFDDLPYRDQIWVHNFRANAVEYYAKGVYRQHQAQVLYETALATTVRNLHLELHYSILLICSFFRAVRN